MGAVLATVIMSPYLAIVGAYAWRTPARHQARPGESWGGSFRLD